MESNTQLLVLIFDINPIWWGLKSIQREGQITKCLDSILVFVNSYLLMNHSNKFAMIGSHSTKSKFLYVEESKLFNENQGGESEDCDARYNKFSSVNNKIVTEFKAMMERGCDINNIKADSLIAGSMANALCYINRVQRENDLGDKLSHRILVVKAADDFASQYMSFMNVIFAAQKQHVTIDACILGHDSCLLQQACDMTNGLYIKVEKQEMMLQYLLTTFLPHPTLRRFDLAIGPSSHKHGVDYRAACFCHRNLVDIGFVCSVCLSIFCQFSPICSTCETAFKPPPMSIKPRKKKKTLKQK